METSGNHSDEPGFCRESLEEFVSVMGEARASEWLDALAERLSSAFEDRNGDPSEIRNMAHSTVSRAGTLGFMELANRCAKLEQAITRRRNYVEELEDVRDEARRVMNVLSRLRVDLKREMRPDDD
ncbi:Hpt domain-containing protein [Rhodobacteraceae bacterium 2376]|uniref:Hpt domain-containing protein n=2 Tax=Rhabdonatronobacter sediminivivens TaxID=2743469 RepID=A0A7Z0I2I2_9RHOB|nr:Hpt domain-containing protein [Rhabdonatronobacter sediminivivens]